MAEQVDGPLVLLVGGEGESEVAVGLGFFFAHLQNFLEHGDCELRTANLHQPVAEDAEQLRILQFHLGHVGQDAQGENGLFLFQKEIGHVGEEGGTAFVFFSLGQVDGVPLSLSGFFELGQVGGLGVPLLELDGARRIGALCLLLSIQCPCGYPMSPNLVQ